MLKSYDGISEIHFGNFPGKFSGNRYGRWIWDSCPISEYNGANRWRWLVRSENPLRYFGILYYESYWDISQGSLFRVLCVTYRTYVITFGLLPATWLRYRGSWRRDRLRRGLCPACGYDLRSEPAGTGPLVPTCPECGLSVVDERRRYEGRLRRIGRSLFPMISRRQA
jgi:hypothetical protein